MTRVPSLIFTYVFIIPMGVKSNHTVLELIIFGKTLRNMVLDPGLNLAWLPPTAVTIAHSSLLTPGPLTVSLRLPLCLCLSLSLSRYLSPASVHCPRPSDRLSRPLRCHQRPEHPGARCGQRYPVIGPPPPSQSLIGPPPRQSGMATNGCHSASLCHPE